MKHALALSLLLCTGPALAQSILYVSKCGPEAASGCIAGSNSNDGTDPANPKLDYVGQINLSTIAAGSTVRLACGSHWEDPGQWYVERLTALNVKVEPYQHPGSGAPVCNITDVLSGYSATDSRPLMTYSTDTTALYCQGGSCNGLWLDGMRFRCTGCSVGSAGLQAMAPSTNIKLTRNDIQGFAIPVFAFTDVTVGAAQHRYFFFQRNRISGGAHGMHGGISQSLIESNLFEGNNLNTSPSGGQQHALYISCPANECPGNLFRWNVIKNNSINQTTGNPESGKCNGGNFTFRGWISENVIERNQIINDVGGATANCYGFSLGAGYSTPGGAEQDWGREYFRRSVVRDNVTSGVDNGYAITTATNLVLDGNKYIHTVAQGSEGGIAFRSPHRGYDDPDDADSGITFRNGLCLYLTSPSSSGTCVQTTDFSGSTMGTSVQLVNMHAHYVANANSAPAWTLKDTPASFARVQGLALTGSNRIWNSSYTSLSAFNARFNSLPSGAVAGAVDAADPDTATTPSSANNWTCTLNSSSPLVDAGSSASRSRLSLATARVNGTDIGACTDR